MAKSILCKIGLHRYDKIVDLDSNISDCESIAKFKKCKKCGIKKIGYEFIIRNEYHYETIDEESLKHGYKGWY